MLSIDPSGQWTNYASARPDGTQTEPTGVEQSTVGKPPHTEPDQDAPNPNQADRPIGSDPQIAHGEADRSRDTVAARDPNNGPLRSLPEAKPPSRPEYEVEEPSQFRSMNTARHDEGELAAAGVGIEVERPTTGQGTGYGGHEGIYGLSSLAGVKGGLLTFDSRYPHT
jgi:hypothetical protein